MVDHEDSSPRTEKDIIYAPWERTFTRISKPFSSPLIFRYDSAPSQRLI